MAAISASAAIAASCSSDSVGVAGAGLGVVRLAAPLLETDLPSTSFTPESKAAANGKDLAEQGLVAINIGGAGEGKTKETGTEGSGGREGEQGGPTGSEGSNGCRPQRSRHSTGPALSEEANELGGLGAPGATNLKCKDSKSAKSGALVLALGATSIERGDQRSIDGKLRGAPERESICDDLDAAIIEEVGSQCRGEGGQHRRGSSGGEVGCWRVLSRTAETKSAMAQRQVGARGRGLGQGIGITGHNVKQLGEAAQNVVVMFGSEHSSECRWEQPKTVVHAREQLEESTVLHGKVLELLGDVLVRSQGAAKDTQTTVLWGQGGVTHPSGGLLRTRTDGVRGAERRRKCKREQGGHEQVALLATFTLRHEVGDAFIVCPHKRRRRAIEQAGEGEHGGGLRRVSELGEHGLAAHEVKCTNAINGKDSAAGVSSGLELEAVGESLSPCTRGQGELVGAGGFINVAAVLLGKCAGNQAAEEVPDNESTDASGWFAQCNEAILKICDGADANL
ncbi:hypothetical protein AK812_SmicGene23031 [Symbiodinium microadriaticum]|uniref:Uncharacterized protein n=1 Tax=Symbiodinium microadriaticum TaxID=2951 RepID=A0A1Q9DIB6_SYMMI|nr:hypothetical protein AK812_SmicGene23031 [Symbiodinium microadriaticum]